MIKAEIVSASAAGVDIKSISKNALKVVRDLQQAGYQAYLVGGCVRDLILGLKPKDFDVSTNATPEQIKKLSKNSRIIGRRFKIVHVRFGYEVIEVATFRANASDRDSVTSNEMSEGDQGQLLRDNVYGKIEEDVVRRDFRANSLYLDPFGDEILDFMGGLNDIRDKKLVSIGEPKLRFTEDPVRMLRVIRFSAKLGFEMEPQALEMIQQEGKLLSHVSSARLFEEVLKLFHGGAAYDTYQMLREYGLFKYLFPFTDQGVMEDVDGMPERALQNTDKRVKQGKPVIPAFLFACMMWDPVRADAQILMTDGTPEAQAWRIAMSDGLRDQNQYVAVPRRLAEIILDIWNIHFRLIKRNPRMVKASLNNRRFRAAYDFLLLRVALHEVDEDVGQWWTDIQEVELEEREAMIDELSEVYKSARKQNQGNENDGNSINYNSNGNSDAYPRSNRGHKAGGRRSGKPSGRKSAGRGRGGSGGGQGQRRRNQGNADPDSIGNTISSGNSRGNGAASNSRRAAGQGPKRRKPTNPRGRRPNSNRTNSPARGGQRDGAYSNPQPKDTYGNYQVGSDESENKKKVKVRHKRRVVGPNTDPEEKPHF